MRLGDFLIFAPLIAFIILEILYAFVWPDPYLSGKWCRMPIFLAICTACHNSVITMVLGIPMERTLNFHKFAGRLGSILGAVHYWVAWEYPAEFATAEKNEMNWNRRYYCHFSKHGADPHFVKFSFDGSKLTGGTCLWIMMVTILITSMPQIRKKSFETFFYFHILATAGAVPAAWFHTRKKVVIVGCVFLGFDWLIRFFFMYTCFYPNNGTIRRLTPTIVEVAWPKGGYDYDGGQWTFIGVPRAGPFQFHAFSVSSSPHHDIGTIHMRIAGDWTKSLWELAGPNPAGTKTTILLDGPVGAFACDFHSEMYKCITMVSGGIGVTPCQSLTEQLLDQHDNHGRELKRIWFLWTSRDPGVMKKMEISTDYGEDAGYVVDEKDEDNEDSAMHQNNAAMSILVQVPQLDTEEALAMEALDDLEDKTGDGGTDKELFGNEMIEDEFDDDDNFDDEEEEEEDNPILEMDLYVTKKQALESVRSVRSGALEKTKTHNVVPFMKQRRPNFDDLWIKYKTEAVAMGENRVAIFTCAPPLIGKICTKMCYKHSSIGCKFDIHNEVAAF